jgi:hypothetical protein
MGTEHNWQKARASSQNGGCLEISYQKADASAQNGGCLEVGYQKAAASTNDGACLEAGEGACGMIHVRDSNTPGLVVDCLPRDFSLFLKAVKLGEFDHLILS